MLFVQFQFTGPFVIKVIAIKAKLWAENAVQYNYIGEIKMLIKSELLLNGMRLAYCVGEDIPSDLKCRKIRIGGRLYDVIKANSSEAFCGRMNALIQLSLNDDEKMPLGRFEIIE